VQGLSNGSKHFSREKTADIVKYGGWGESAWGHGPWGSDYLAIQLMGGKDVTQSMPLSMLIEVVIRFWRDFLREHGPYKELPEGKTKVAEL
jgi:hypothetical protein